MSDALAVLSSLVPGGVRERWLERGGARRLHLLEAGCGEDVVVFEAGRNDSALTWTPLFIRLAPLARLVAYDRAGLGESDPDPGPPRLSRFLADLGAVVDAATERSCVLVGHSFGGRLAHLFAGAHPERVAGAVLVDPGCAGLSSVLHSPERSAAAALLRRTVGALGADRLRSAVESHQTVATFTTDRPRRKVLAEAYRHRAACGDELAGLDPKDAACVARFSRDLPLVVLSATRHMAAPLRARWTAMQAEIAGEVTSGRHAVVADCGHAIHHERPDRVAEAIVEVVGRVYGNDPR